MDPATIAMIASTVAGFFGPNQKLSPEQKFQMDIANQFKGFAGSAPLSDPGERMALAQQRGLLGEEQRTGREQLFSQLGAIPGQQSGLQDLLRNITQSEIGQRMQLDSQALMEALAQRRQALLQASQTAQGVGSRQERPGIGSALTAFAQMYGQQQAMKKGQDQQNAFMQMMQQYFGGGQPTTGGGPGTGGIQAGTGPSGGQGIWGGGYGGPKAQSTPGTFDPQLNMPRPNTPTGPVAPAPMDAHYGIPSPNYNLTMTNLSALFKMKNSMQMLR